MRKSNSLEDVIVLDTNAIINIARRNDWIASIETLSVSYKVIVPTPALYEFQLYKHKSGKAEIEFGKYLSSSLHYDCLGFQLAQGQHKLGNGLYIVNPTHREWLAATNRMSRHIELRGLRSSGIKKRHMDHIIYSIARNILATVCTDNSADFLDITKIAEESGWHDGEITIKPLSEYLGEPSTS